MNFIIYSGSYNVNMLGATKSIDIMLVKNIEKLGYSVVWVGRGDVNISICKYHNIGNSKIFEFMMRVYNKLKRIVFKITPNEQALKEFFIYDRRLANLIKNNIIEVNESTVMIGRNGMSLLSFQEVKKRGGTTVLHSQWMHPISHNEFLKKEYERIGLDKEPIPLKRIERQLEEIKIVDKIWCISTLVEKSYLENKIAKEELISASLGVDISLYENLDKSKRDDEEFRILFVGNVNPEKGAHILLKSILNIESKVKITLIFNGNIAGYFKEIFDKYVMQLTKKGTKVLIKPGVPLQNYSDSSIFVLPSVHESFGLVVLEAMASGLPVIVSDNVGSKDCISNKTNGFIFKKNDDKELTKIIQKLIDNNNMVQQMGEQSIKLAKEYDWSCVTSNLIDNIKKG
ncbi:MAG: hypothetical protein DRG78_02710 [Epsilonproteobacteria bacterium]|nr:MAG: hypothetical protein DRG78_02710 [Campylobacterota bacterium]